MTKRSFDTENSYEDEPMYKEWWVEQPLDGCSVMGRSDLYINKRYLRPDYCPINRVWRVSRNHRPSINTGSRKQSLFISGCHGRYSIRWCHCFVSVVTVPGLPQKPSDIKDWDTSDIIKDMFSGSIKVKIDAIFFGYKGCRIWGTKSFGVIHSYIFHGYFITLWSRSVNYIRDLLHSYSESMFSLCAELIQ